LVRLTRKTHDDTPFTFFFMIIPVKTANY